MCHTEVVVAGTCVRLTGVVDLIISGESFNRVFIR